jgi:ABC-type lipoprotein release transport system permease subunit
MEIEDIKRIISQALEKYPKAKRIAVENFLATSVNYDYTTQLMNLQLDAKLYKWNSDTIKAIRLGLKLMFQK